MSAVGSLSSGTVICAQSLSLRVHSTKDNALTFLESVMLMRISGRANSARTNSRTTFTLRSDPSWLNSPFRFEIGSSCDQGLSGESD